MSIPQMHPVVSSNLQAVGHDGQALYVTFKPGKGGTVGRTYRYAGAPATLLNDLQTAQSAGSFFAQHVKKAYTGIPVGADGAPIVDQPEQPATGG